MSYSRTINKLGLEEKPTKSPAQRPLWLDPGNKNWMLSVPYYIAGEEQQRRLAVDRLAAEGLM